MQRSRVEAGEVCLRGWHYPIEDGKVLVADVERGRFERYDAAVETARAE